MEMQHSHSLGDDQPLTRASMPSPSSMPGSERALRLGMHWRKVSAVDLGQLFGTSVGSYFAMLKYAGYAVCPMAVLMLVKAVANFILSWGCHPDSQNSTLLFRFTFGARCGSPWPELLGMWAVAALLVVVTFASLYQSVYYGKVTGAEVSCGQYAITVRGLPRDASPQEIATFFARFGPVLYVERPRESGALWKAVQHLSQLQRGSPATPGIGRIQRDSRLGRARRRVRELREQSWQAGTLAFVTFKYQHGAAAAERYFIAQRRRPHGASSCCGKRESGRAQPTFRDTHHIVAQSAAEPSLVLWENLQGSSADRTRRQCGTWLLLMCSILVGSVITGLVRSPLAFSPGRLQPNILAEWGLPPLVAAAPLAVLTVVINECMRLLSRRAARWEAHETLNDQERWRMVKLFLSQVANVVFVQWYLHGLPREEEGWYTDCAAYLLAFMVVSTFKPLLPVLWRRLLAWRQARSATYTVVSSPDELLQVSAEEASKAALNGPFNLAEAYAEALAVMTVGMVYSVVVPITMPLAGLHMLVSYMMHKHELLHLHACPPMLDVSLVRWTGILLSLGAMLYGIIGGVVAAFAGTGTWPMMLLAALNAGWIAHGGMRLRSVRGQTRSIMEPYHRFWQHPTFSHPLVEHGADRYSSGAELEGAAVATLATDEDITNPQLFSPMPGPRWSDHVRRWQHMKTQLGRHPYLVEELAYIIKFEGKAAPAGVVCAGQSQPFAAMRVLCCRATLNTYCADVRELRRAIIVHILHHPGLLRDLHEQYGAAPTASQKIDFRFAFTAGSEADSPELLCKKDECTARAAMFWPMVTLVWPALRAGSCRYRGRVPNFNGWAAVEHDEPGVTEGPNLNRHMQYEPWVLNYDPTPPTPGELETA